jgi:hypothetical protein
VQHKCTFPYERACFSFTLYAVFRLIFNRCRLLPALMETVVHFCSIGGKLPPELAQEWKHYEKIGLPSAGK